LVTIALLHITVQCLSVDTRAVKVLAHFTNQYFGIAEYDSTSRLKRRQQLD
jgi:hypothetical protein